MPPRLMVAAFVVAASFTLSVSANSINDCHSVRYAYRERGLDLRDVPRQPRQGEHLLFLSFVGLLGHHRHFCLLPLGWLRAEFAVDFLGGVL